MSAVLLLLLECLVCVHEALEAICKLVLLRPLVLFRRSFFDLRIWHIFVDGRALNDLLRQVSFVLLILRNLILQLLYSLDHIRVFALGKLIGALEVLLGLGYLPCAQIGHATSVERLVVVWLPIQCLRGVFNCQLEVFESQVAEA